MSQIQLTKQFIFAWCMVHKISVRCNWKRSIANVLFCWKVLVQAPVLWMLYWRMMSDGMVLRSRSRSPCSWPTAFRFCRPVNLPAFFLAFITNNYKYLLLCFVASLTYILLCVHALSFLMYFSNCSIILLLQFWVCLIRICGDVIIRY